MTVTHKATSLQDIADHLRWLAKERTEDASGLSPRRRDYAKATAHGLIEAAEILEATTLVPEKGG